MLTVDCNDQTKCIQVHTADEQQSMLVADGKFAWDQPDRTVLVAFHHLAIGADQPTQLNEFLSTVLSHVSKTYKSLVGVRLPTTFDRRIDFEQLQFKNNIAIFMVMTMDQARSEPNLVLEEPYELITDRNRILNYAEQLMRMMNETGFWSTKWKLEEMRDRIHSAKSNVMILDKTDDTPCGFGRLFVLTMPNKETFGYLSDIGVRASHQSKGLGRVIVNSLIDAFRACDRTSDHPHGTLWLQCADRGCGVVSAPKLYRRAGFELFEDLGNRIAAFASNEYYQSNYKN